MSKLINILLLIGLLSCGGIFTYMLLSDSPFRFLLGCIVASVAFQIMYYIYYGKFFNPTVDKEGCMITHKEAQIIEWAEEAVQNGDPEVKMALMQAATIVTLPQDPLKAVQD